MTTDPIPEFQSRVRNDLFDSTIDFDRGASKFKFAMWYCVKLLFFTSRFPWPMFFKVALLKAFGAKLGTGLCLKPRVDIYFPWKLIVGNHAWIGEGVTILNFEHVEIGDHCCISQNAYLCCGNHDFRSAEMRYRNAAIEIMNGAWIGAGSIILPGKTIGIDAVVCAGAVVDQNVANNTVVQGNPAKPIGERWKATDSTSSL